ncbi:MAG: hypothetical protein JSW68_10170 [Burkholderiales bacterium]|nr:MAG: hypothetical protein JSW68_10170 [Burkholderiales bacterium]
MAKTHYFADRIINIRVHNNVVRIELGIQLPPQEGETQPQYEATAQVIMPIDGFAQSARMMQNAVQRLAQRAREAQEARGGQAGGAAVGGDAPAGEATGGEAQ